MVTEDEQDQWAEHEQSRCCAANKHHYVMLVRPRGRSAQHTAFTNQPGKHKWMTSKSSKPGTPRYHTAGMHTLLVAHEDFTYCQRHGQLCHSCSHKSHKEYLLEYISAPPHAHAADCRITASIRYPVWVTTTLQHMCCITGRTLRARWASLSPDELDKLSQPCSMIPSCGCQSGTLCISHAMHGPLGSSLGRRNTFGCGVTAGA